MLCVVPDTRSKKWRKRREASFKRSQVRIATNEPLSLCREKLEPFVAVVRTQLKSRSWKLRLLAARCLASLCPVPQDEVLSALSALANSGETTSYNELQARLRAANVLLRANPNWYPHFSSGFETLLSLLVSFSSGVFGTSPDIHHRKLNLSLSVKEGAQAIDALHTHQITTAIADLLLSYQDAEPPKPALRASAKVYAGKKDTVNLKWQ